MTTALIALSWILIAATLLPLIEHEAWWIRIFDFPRAQIAFCGAACIAGLALGADGSGFLQTATMVSLAFATAYHGWELLRYTPLRNVQSLLCESNDPKRRIRMLIANVLMCNRQVEAYVALVRKHSPDVVVLVETNGFWEERLRTIEQDYPFTIRSSLDNTYGMLLYSRLALTERRIRFRIQEDVPSFSTLVELRTGDLVELHTIHPRPPKVGKDTEHRDAELVVVAKEVKDSPRPVIVTGDLNDVAWSHTTRLFLRISGLLDPRVGRMFCNTFHAAYPMFRWPLDHLFHSRSFRLVTLGRLDRSGSDHFPVLIELSFEPETKTEQERPAPDAEDFEEAQEKLERVNESE